MQRGSDSLMCGNLASLEARAGLDSNPVGAKPWILCAYDHQKSRHSHWALCWHKGALYRKAQHLLLSCPSTEAATATNRQSKSVSTCQSVERVEAMLIPVVLANRDARSPGSIAKEGSKPCAGIKSSCVASTCPMSHNTQRRKPQTTTLTSRSAAHTNPVFLRTCVIL